MKRNKFNGNYCHYRNENFVVLGLVGTTVLSGALLTLPSALADDSTVTDVAITVPVACSITSTQDSAHTASVDSGTYQDNIGKTTIKATCNDSQGFSIYAIGHTNEEYGNTTLKPSVLDATQNSIITGTATSGATSNWAMKLTAGTGMTSTNILSDTDGAYSNYHKVPTAYTKVATMASNTNATTGASIEATYGVYISGDQPADTYNGKVKYTMVHPANEPAPFVAKEETTASGKICYYPNTNEHEGTMGCQDIIKERDWSSCSYTDYETFCRDGEWNEINIGDLPELDTYVDTYTLLASNYSRTGYGFAGWSDKFDYATNANAKFYGPNETIIITPADYQSPNGGLAFYAVWVKSQGNLQDSNKVASVCSGLDAAPTDGTANLSSVSALTDQRDNNTYAIAKLADNKCWMIENLRLEADNTRTEEKQALAQGYGTSATYGNFGGLADAENTGFTSTYSANSLYYSGTQEGTASIDIGTSNYPVYRMPRYNNLNTTNRAANPTSNTFTNNNTTGGMYSYGNYYTWHAAIADTTHNDSNNTSSDNTSICPKGWRLPRGGQNTVTSGQNGDFYVLTTTISGTTPNIANDGYAYYSGTVEGVNVGKLASDSLRGYPNNFLYSGFFHGSSAYYRGSRGYYRSSTAYDYSSSYGFYLDSSSVNPGTYSEANYRGLSIRCVSGS